MCGSHWSSSIIDIKGYKILYVNPSNTCAIKEYRSGLFDIIKFLTNINDCVYFSKCVEGLPVFDRIVKVFYFSYFEYINISFIYFISQFL